MNFLRFVFLGLIKIFGYILYPTKLNWISQKPKNWDDVSLILILNHTSLFEFVYSTTLPYSFINNLSKKLVLPVASKTLAKPVSGFIFSKLAPKIVSLSRKRDASWDYFLSQIDSSNDICIFMPEGQMKRSNGLDKNGNPMIVKTGVFEILNKFKSQNMVIFYSHGLHHVMAPEMKFPRIFKKISADIEYLKVKDYLDQFKDSQSPAKEIASDLQKRRDQYC